MLPVQYLFIPTDQIPQAVFDETTTASFNSSDTLTAWGDEEDEDEGETEIAGIWNDFTGEQNILMIQLPQVTKTRGEKRKSSDQNENQVRVKRCRATFGTENKESWCKPCRIKKKGLTCLRLS